MKKEKITSIGSPLKNQCYQSRRKQKQVMNQVQKQQLQHKKGLYQSGTPTTSMAIVLLVQNLGIKLKYVDHMVSIDIKPIVLILETTK